MIQWLGVEATKRKGLLAPEKEECSRLFQFHWSGNPSLLFAGILLLIAGVVRAGEWREFGPAPITDGHNTGRLSSLAVSPVDRNRIYIGAASGGVWRTLDGGLHWTPITDFLPTCAVGAIALDPNNDRVVYVGSGEANYANHSLYGLGLYKSEDGGDTWAVLGAETFSGRTFSRIVVSPANTQVVFAAIGYAGGFPARRSAKGHPQANGPAGIFRSLDGGVTWTQLRNGLPDLPATDLAMDPSNSDILYAGVTDIFGHPLNGLYKTIDGGNTWVELLGSFPQHPGRISVAVSPVDPRRIYALTSEISDLEGRRTVASTVFRSSDGGGSWVHRNPGLNGFGFYYSAIVAHPSNLDTFFIGHITLLRSTSGGTFYEDITPPHVDVHALALDSAGNLLCGDDGGIHYGLRNGDDWLSLNYGIGVVQFYPGLSLHPIKSEIVIAGAQDNGTTRSIGDGIWSHVLGGDGGYTAVHPATPHIALAEFQGTGNLFRLDFSGGGVGLANASAGISVTDRNCFLPPVTYSPESHTKLLYGTHRVYQSTDNGARWTAISGDLTGDATAAIRGLVIAPSNPQTVYATTNDGRVLVSTNGGADFSLKLTNIPGWPRVKREIAVDPHNDAVAYLAVAYFGTDQVRKTTDRGDTWEPMDGDFPDMPANTVAVHKEGEGSNVFVGTDAGVYVTCDGGTHWRKLGRNLPNTSVMDLVVDLPHDRLVAGTLGRGVWSIPLPHADSNQDGHVDLQDLAGFQNCFTGPAGPADSGIGNGTCLDAFDFDFDEDSDLYDLACFPDRITGP